MLDTALWDPKGADWALEVAGRVSKATKQASEARGRASEAARGILGARWADLRLLLSNLRHKWAKTRLKQSNLRLISLKEGYNSRKSVTWSVVPDAPLLVS